MNENAVIFKGTKEGLYIIIKEELDFEQVKQNLENKIKPSKKFFEGARIVNFKGKQLSREQFEELKEIVRQDYGMTVLGDYVDISSDTIVEREDNREPKPWETLPYEDILEGPSLIVRATIRSGQLISYDGNIIVIGDVNPGAHIKATGSIVIMGTIRGVAHGGANGDYGAFIAAYNLQPTQLRIGDIITRSPDNVYKTSNPEMAVVRQGMIIVEPYLPNR